MPFRSRQARKSCFCGRKWSWKMLINSWVKTKQHSKAFSWQFGRFGLQRWWHASVGKAFGSHLPLAEYLVAVSVTVPKFWIYSIFQEFLRLGIFFRSEKKERTVDGQKEDTKPFFQSTFLLSVWSGIQSRFVFLLYAITYVVFSLTVQGKCMAVWGFTDSSTYLTFPTSFVYTHKLFKGFYMVKKIWQAWCRMHLNKYLP